MAAFSRSGCAQLFIPRGQIAVRDRNFFRLRSVGADCVTSILKYALRNCQRVCVKEETVQSEYAG